jgi:hypothetical protein
LTFIFKITCAIEMFDFFIMTCPSSVS